MRGTLKTRADCLTLYGSDYKIQQQVQEGQLYRVGKGIFAEESHAPDVVVLCFQYPNAILTMHSALYLYNLIDQIPYPCYLATDQDGAWRRPWTTAAIPSQSTPRSG